MIRQPLSLAFAGLLAVVLIGYVIERMIFLSTAVKASGTVISVDAHNGRCGGGRRRAKNPCTKFNSTVEFQASNGRPYRFSVSSGSTRGSDKPTSNARLKIGAAVPVVYSPKDPSKAYEDSLWGVWAIPIFLFVGHLAALVASFMEPRRRRASIF